MRKFFLSVLFTLAAIGTALGDDCANTGQPTLDELRCRLAIAERELRVAVNLSIINEAKLRLLQDELAKLKPATKPPT